MANKKCQLNDIFNLEFMDIALERYGLKPKQDYPELQQILITYKNKLEKTPRHSSFLKFGETFTRKIYYNDDNFYLVSWSIRKIKKEIANYEPPLYKFALNEIIHIVDQAGINNSHLGFALNNNAPIFMASYPPLVSKDKFLIIDGNHRVTSKYKNGQQTITAYWLEPEKHLRAMRNELDRILFKIHYNYYMIASYIGGVISKTEVKEALYNL